MSISLTVPCEPHLSNTRGYLDIDLFETLRSHNMKFPKEINFTCPEAWKEIYGHVELPLFFPEGTGMDDGDTVHSTVSNNFRLRRVMLLSFSEKALRQQEPLIRVYVDLSMERLREIADEGHSTNMIRCYNFTTFDLNADLACGEEVHGLAERGSKMWIDNIEKLDAAHAYLGSNDNLASTLKSLTICGRAQESKFSGQAQTSLREDGNGENRSKGAGRSWRYHGLHDEKLGDEA